MKNFIVDQIDKLQSALNTIRSDGDLLSTIEKISARCLQAIEQNQKILFAGNGGSASDAQHLAAELVCRYKDNRPAIAAIALTTDTSALTAIGNDFGYEHLFARQVEALGRPGDIFFAFSTSGSSPNILKALEQAKSQGLITIGFTGQTGGKMSSLCDYLIKIPSIETAKIQECHITLGHIICAYIEERILNQAVVEDLV